MANYIFQDGSGLIVPDYSKTLERVKTKMRQELAMPDLTLEQETPQGALAVAIADMSDSVMRSNAETANQVNIDYAENKFLDALSLLFTVQRNAATKSTLSGVILTGEQGAIIQAGSRASDGKNLWQILDTVTIPQSGQALADFQCMEAGAINCEIVQLNKIVDSALGWKTVSNPTPASIGSEQEKDFKFKRRFKRMLGAQGSESIYALTAAIYAVEGVKSVMPWENKTNAPIFKDGIEIPPHSLYLCIQGGDGEAIARAIKSKKGIGGATHGDETVTIVDKISQQHYSIKFSRPNSVDLTLRVTVKPSAINATDIIPKIIREWEAGDSPIDAGCEVGRSISPFEIAAAINHAEPLLFVRSIEISDDAGASWLNSERPIAINEIAVIGSILVVVS